jgi:hypothetical protein
VPSQPGDQQVLRVQLAAYPEPTADLALDQVHGVLGHPEERGGDPAVEVLDLRRAPDGDAFERLVVLRDQPAGL